MSKLNLVEGIVQYTKKELTNTIVNISLYDEQYDFNTYELNVYGLGNSKQGKTVAEGLSHLLGGREYTYEKSIKSYSVRFRYLEEELLRNVHTLLRIKGYNMKNNMELSHLNKEFASTMKKLSKTNCVDEI